MAALNVFMPLAVLAVLGFLVILYVRLLVFEVGELLYPSASHVSAEAAVGAVEAAVAAWELARHHARKCGKLWCHGLKKAVEFDIQLEMEECTRRLPCGGGDEGPRAALLTAAGARSVELGDAHWELEVELWKKRRRWDSGVGMESTKEEEAALAQG